MSAYSRDPGKSNVAPQTATEKQAEAPIAVDGFQQVLEMLQAADPAFRESLLRRLASRDPRLARDLRADLALL